MDESGISSPAFKRKCRPRRGGNFKHGFSDSRLAKILENAITRCHNQRHDSYPNYGGNGIRVCDDWRFNAAAFIAWALSNGYRDRLEIDRRDTSKGYSPENCRWVTHAENQNNRTNNRRIEFNGESLTATQWGRRTGIGRTTICNRLDLGWSVEAALTTPPNRRR